MATTAQTSSFNVTAQPSVAATQHIGSNPHVGMFKDPIKTNAVETRKVNISGQADWEAEEAPVAKTEQKEVVEKKAPPPSAERHEEWKQQQALDKAKRSQDKYNKTIERQKTAPELLKAGDINGAAQALGIPVAELVSLTNKALLGIPTKPEEMTPEQKKDKEMADYKASVQAELEEHRNYRKSQQEREIQYAKAEWQKSNISPLMDTEKFPLLTQNKEAIPQIMAGLYEWFNQKYLETQEKDDKGNPVSGTGWQPTKQDIEDALETMESQYQQRAEATIKTYKGIKKFSKFFTAEEAAVVEKANEQTSQEEEDGGKPIQRNNLGSVSQSDRDFNVFKKSSEGEVPFALLSTPEKVKYLREHAND